MPSRWPLSLRALAEIAVIGGERRADRAAGIARRRLHPDAVEDALAQQLAVGDAVQRHAAGQADVLGAGLLRTERARRSTISSVTAWTEAARSMCCWVSSSSGVARRPAEQRGERVVGHAQPGAIVEVALVEAEDAVFLEVDDVSRIMSCAYFGSP